MADQTVFSTRQALTRGFTPGQLRSMKRERLLRGVYSVEPDAAQLIVQARAAVVAAGPQARLCEATALRLAGIEMPKRFEDDDRIHIQVSHAISGPRRDGICRHRSAQQLPGTDIAGLPSLHLAECWMQLAARATDEELVVVGDGMMRRPRPPDQRPFLVAPEVLTQAVAESPRRPGIRAVRRTVELVRPRTDSPMESVTRFYLVRAGLPQPAVNFPILDETGWPVYFIDMAYPDVKVAVEYDGAIHAGKARQIRADIGRRRRLEADGWRFIIATSDDLPDRMGTVVRITREALCSRGAI